MPTSSASSCGSPARSSGSRSTPSTLIARSQVRWFRPTCSSSTRDGSTPKRLANVRWKPIATLHRPIARWPASSSAWVTIPTGFVKSTIQASGAARRSTCSASSRTTGTVRRAFAKPPAPVVSWPTQPNRSGGRLVAQAGRLAAHPELDHDEVRAVDRGVAVGRGHEPAAPAAVVEHPAGEAADDVEPLGVDVEQRELVHAEALLAGGEAFHELGGVRAAASDDGDLHAHRLPARSARRSSTARPPSRLPCWTGALTPRRPRTILLITIAATNVRSTIGARRCGHWR